MDNGCYWVWYWFHDRTLEVTGKGLTQTEIIDNYVYSVPYIEDNEKKIHKNDNTEQQGKKKVFWE